MAGPFNVSVLAPTENAPAVSVNVPPMVGLLLLSATPLALLIVTLLNDVFVDPEMVCADVPLNMTVPVDAVKLPLLTKFPLME
jgi:hypothetical protein